MLQVDVAEIVMHEAYDPDAVVDLLDADTLTGKHVGEVDPFAVHADATAGCDHDLTVVQWITEVGQAGIAVSSRVDSSASHMSR